MKRNYQIGETGVIDNQNLIQQIAFHEAGHAAGIHLYNKQNQLPQVCFQITFKMSDDILKPSQNAGSQAVTPVAAEIEGGRLIQSLPVDLLESTHYFSSVGSDALRTAYEADIINLLIGSLAEMKQVALRDYNYFDERMVSMNALHRYGGASDLEEACNYLQGFITCKEKRDAKLAELLERAQQFIAEPDYWRAIELLADYILSHRERIIYSEEVIAVLDEIVSGSNRGVI